MIVSIDILLLDLLLLNVIIVCVIISDKQFTTIFDSKLLVVFLKAGGIFHAVISTTDKETKMHEPKKFKIIRICENGGTMFSINGNRNSHFHP